MTLTDSWPYPLVEVVWDDAANDNGWEIASEVEMGEELVMTVGFLIKKTRKHILLAASLSKAGEGEYHTNTRQQIPCGMIKSMRVLVPKNSPKASDGATNPT